MDSQEKTPPESALRTESSTILPLEPPSGSVPEWYPDWAREMAGLYFSANTCVFLLHGNVHDLIYREVNEGGKKTEQFCDLTAFLSQQMFGSWDAVAAYDLGRGLRPEAGADAERHKEMMKILSGYLGSPKGWPRDSDQVLDVVDQITQRNLLVEDKARRNSMAYIFNYAQFMIPEGDLAMLARGQASRLVRVLSWAQNPYIKKTNMAFCLVAETLTEVNSRLVQNPHIATIEIPLPNDTLRRKYISLQLGEKSAKSQVEVADPVSEQPSLAGASGTGESSDEENADAETEELSVEAVTQLSNGLNLINLSVAISRSKIGGNKLDVFSFRKLKKGLIERQCYGLVNFIEPSVTLDLVVGHTAAKARLKQDGQWIAEGRLDAAPMGYLICGPVGTGKTFLAECYAGSIGIPCVVLRNFRSKYVGETEGNLEKVLTVLRSLGPVIVIIDEADAALGNRGSSGDSGTSSRVFSMIASQMGNTKYRGKILWMLLTSRPDMLPIDLKRQGRAEVHIPLFYPQEDDEVAKMFRVMARKNKVKMADDADPNVSAERNLSGADIESVVLGAKRRVMTDNRDMISADDLKQALESFIPSAQGLEKERQEMCAVLECTDKAFLTDEWREKLKNPNGRALLQQRVAELNTMFDH